MADEYRVKSTSNVSAEVEDRVISSNGTNRRVLRATLIRNHKDPNASVRISIVHQKKKMNDEWEDLPNEPLTSMKAGEIKKLNLDSSETLVLHQELERLFAIRHEKGVPYGEKKLIVGFDSEIIKADPQRTKLIEELLKAGHSKQVWQELVKHNPDLATKLCTLRLHQSRVDALRRFETAMKETTDEAFWQKFFEQNTWIFGYGLHFRFLSSVQDQPYYGGKNLSGSGGQRGDFLSASVAAARFTVLVEVKKPSTKLLAQEYRNGAYPASLELSGGVSQLQANCRNWEIQGAQTEENREILSELRISTIQPKGILIIGNTDELGKSAMKASFEMFRRNLANPEIITFDELLERARFIVDHPEHDDLKNR